MSWSSWVLVACAVLALVLMAVGALRAAIAARALKTHSEQLKTVPLLDELAKAEADVARINDALEGMTPLLARAQAAIVRLQMALETFRSLRLLFGRFPTPR